MRKDIMMLLTMLGTENLKPNLMIGLFCAIIVFAITFVAIQFVKDDEEYDDDDEY